MIGGVAEPSLNLRSRCPGMSRSRSASVNAAGLVGEHVVSLRHLRLQRLPQMPFDALTMKHRIGAFFPQRAADS